MKRLSLILLGLSIAAALSGYLRELAIASRFGAGIQTDAYFVAISIPTVISDLIVGSALTASVVPVFAMNHARAKIEPSIVLSMFLVSVLGLTMVIGALLSWKIKEVVGFLAPGLDSAGRALAIEYSNWLVWLLPLAGVNVLFAQTLNAFRSFVPAALSWVVINTVFFATVLFMSNLLGSQTFIVAALAGPICVTLFLTWRVYIKGGFRVSSPKFATDEGRTAGRLVAPIVATLGIGGGVGLLMVCHLLLRKYGSSLEVGTVSALSYAFRIYEIPLSLVMATVGVLAFPTLSSAYESRNLTTIASMGRELVFWGVTVLVPIAAITYEYAEPIVDILFGGGAFGVREVGLTATSLRGFAPAIIFEAFVMIFIRVSYAIHRPAVGVIVGVLTVLTLWVLLEAMQPSRPGEIAELFSIAFGMGAFVSIVAVSFVLRMRLLPGIAEVALPLIVALLAGMLVNDIVATNFESVAQIVLGSLSFIVIYIFLLAIALPKRRTQLVNLMFGGRTD